MRTEFFFMPKMKYAKHVMPNKIVTFKIMLLVFTYYRY